MPIGVRNRLGVGTGALLRAFPQGTAAAAAVMLLAIAWSWPWWAASSLAGGTETAAGGLSWLIGGLGPTVAVIVWLRRSTQDYRHAFRQRLLDWHVAPVWLVAATAFAVGPKLVGIAIAALAGHAATGDAMGLADLPVALIFGLIVVAIEEPLWRGAALDSFDSKAIGRAGFVIGVFWSVWHIPLFAVDGTFQSDLGFGSLDFFVFLSGIVGLSVVMTWMVVQSGRAIPLAMFTHFMINLNGEFLPDDTTIRVLEMCLIWCVAGIVLLKLRSGRMQIPAALTRALERKH